MSQINGAYYRCVAQGSLAFHLLLSSVPQLLLIFHISLAIIDGMSSDGRLPGGFIPCDTAKEFGDSFHVECACHMHFGAKAVDFVYDIKPSILRTDFQTSQHRTRAPERRPYAQEKKNRHPKHREDNQTLMGSRTLPETETRRHLPPAGT